jgi:hypothetical protein
MNCTKKSSWTEVALSHICEAWAIIAIVQCSVNAINGRCERRSRPKIAFLLNYFVYRKFCAKSDKLNAFAQAGQAERAANKTQIADQDVIGPRRAKYEAKNGASYLEVQHSESRSPVDLTTRYSDDHYTELSSRKGGATTMQKICLWPQTR